MLRARPYCMEGDFRLCWDLGIPAWGRRDPGGPHVGPMNLAIRLVALRAVKHGQYVIPGCFRGMENISSSMRHDHRVCSRTNFGIELLLHEIILVDIFHIRPKQYAWIGPVLVLTFGSIRPGLEDDSITEHFFDAPFDFIFVHMLFPSHVIL